MLYNIAVCIFGSQFDLAKTLKIESYLKSLFDSKFNLVFFNDFTNQNYLKNLFNVCYQKQKYEFEKRTIFEGCIALNIDNNLVTENLLITKKDIDLFLNLDLNTLYFLSGENKNNKTCIDISGFFANSFIFDTVCNFPLMDIQISQDRDDTVPRNIEEKFYWFNKSLKIKTKCVNYENCSLFKRPA